MKNEYKLKMLEAEIRELISHSNLKEVSDLILKVSTESTACEHGYVAFVDPENGDSVGISFSHMTGACENYEKLGEARFKVLNDGIYGGLLGYSLDTGKALYTNHPSSHPIAHGLPPGHEPVENFLSVPVKDDNMILGQIVVGNCGKGFNEEDVKIIEKIAAIYSIALKNFLWDK
jgi:GAF domain-containing protein